MARPDLTAYLRSLSEEVEVLVVDGSAPEVFDQHRRLFAPPIRHLPVDPARVTPMGKVGGVMTGVAAASFDRVVIADDDVVWTVPQLRRALDLLARADVVRPQNAFDALPWHARWDTGRILLNRVFGGDWPGTLAVRRSTLLRAGGYAGDVMFENLELVRTVRDAGGRSLLALDLVVARHPPPVRQFLDQRVRQAYDELARPHRLLASLAIAPGLALTGRRGAAVVAAGSVAVAEIGRRRAGGRAAFAPTAALWAPLWVAERSVTSWLAVWSLLRHGGVRYRGTVLRRAATPRRRRRARVRRAVLSR